MIYNITITSIQGNILYKRYYELDLDEDTKVEWEQSLYELKDNDFKNLEPETYQIDMIDDKYILYTIFGECVIYLTGCEEYDELTLCEIMDIIKEVITVNILTKGKDLTEAMFINDLDKVAIGISEIISPLGIIDLTDITKINSFTNMKPQIEFDRKKKTKKNTKSSSFINQSNIQTSHLTTITKDDIHNQWRQKYINRNSMI
eukprot:TRINITY_DN525_c3_g1_i1.p1 TRINITY_DN525_c3_g1~~TRINITY_DN525_c3_g1_i1.p1  ORF type:complete len:203 (+),score=42.00 TRINITY_DN525_c3_g1_i1:166-774(+)